MVLPLLHKIFGFKKYSMWSRILSWLCACGLGAGMCASGWYRDAGWCCQPLVHTATNARSQPFSVCRASDNGANSQGQGFGKSINGGFIVVGCIWNIRRFQCCHRRELWCWFIFWGGLSLHVIHERAWRGPQDYCILSKVNSLNGREQAPCFHTVWFKVSGSSQHGPYKYGHRW